MVFLHSNIFKFLFFLGTITPWLQFFIGPLWVLFSGWRKNIKYLILYTIISILSFLGSVYVWDFLFHYAKDGGALMIVFWLTIVYPFSFLIALLFPTK